jgi:hypothetical protein
MMVLVEADDQIVGHELRANIPAVSDISKVLQGVQITMYLKLISKKG